MKQAARSRGFLVFLVVGVGLALSMQAMAVERTVQQLFSDSDENGDGVLDRNEHERYLELTFAQDDADHDGSLSRKEVAQSMARSSQVGLTASSPQIQRAIVVSFPLLDRNGDGRISRQESLAFAGQSFLASDADHDGKLSLLEMTSKTPGH